jgi:hypothetical protein
VATESRSDIAVITAPANNGPATRKQIEGHKNVQLFTRVIFIKILHPQSLFTILTMK